MGGRPNPGTKPDKRLKVNKPRPKSSAKPTKPSKISRPAK